MPATAMIKVGIPLATPYPLVLSLKRHGTTTAGDTAAIMEPNNYKTSDIERRLTTYSLIVTLFIK